MIPKQLRVPVIKGEERKAKLEKMADIQNKGDKTISKTYSVANKIIEGISKYKPKNKKVIKPNKMEVHIQNKKPAEYVPIYFQAELNKTKEDMGFWK